MVNRTRKGLRQSKPNFPEGAGWDVVQSCETKPISGTAGWDEGAGGGDEGQLCDTKPISLVRTKAKLVTGPYFAGADDGQSPFGTKQAQKLFILS
jgi:hypothetical protein